MRKFAKLREAVHEREESLEDLAAALGICTAALSLKLNGKRPFKLAEMWVIMDHLKIPDTQFHKIFPREGA